MTDYKLTEEVEQLIHAWIEAQHGTAGWEQKLVNLFDQEIQRAVEAEREQIEKNMVIEYYIPQYASPSYEAFSIHYDTKLDCVFYDISTILQNHGFDVALNQKTSKTGSFAIFKKALTKTETTEEVSHE